MNSPRPNGDTTIIGSSGSGSSLRVASSSDSPGRFGLPNTRRMFSRWFE